MGLSEQLKNLTPTNEELLKMAEESPPPASWYEDCVNPFEAISDD